MQTIQSPLNNKSIAVHCKNIHQLLQHSSMLKYLALSLSLPQTLLLDSWKNTKNYTDSFYIVLLLGPKLSVWLPWNQLIWIYSECVRSKYHIQFSDTRSIWTTCWSALYFSCPHAPDSSQSNSPISPEKINLHRLNVFSVASASAVVGVWSWSVLFWFYYYCDYGHFSIGCLINSARVGHVYGSARTGLAIILLYLPSMSVFGRLSSFANVAWQLEKF